jgi:RNase PH
VPLGIKENKVWLDKNYEEESTADTDKNIIMNDKNQIIENQGTAEEAPISKTE